MADQKVSDLPSLNGADVDAADLLYIVDSSAGAAGSKKITIGQYQLAPVSGGTANTVVYLNGSKVESSSSALTFDGTNFATTGTSSAAKLIPTGGTATGNGMYLPAANTLAWSNNGAETMRLDSSGNLGLGVTPSAWNSAVKAMQISTAATFWGLSNNQAYVGSNSFYDAAGNFKYIVTDSATQYRQWQGAHAWFNAPSGTAGNAISFTQAMTLTSGGVLQVGTTQTTAASNVAMFGSMNPSVAGTVRIGSNDQNNAALSLTNWTGATTNNGVRISFDNSGRGGFEIGASSGSNNFDICATWGTPLARIDSSGNMGLGATTISNSRFQIKGASNNTAVFTDGLRVTSNNETVEIKYSWTGIDASSNLIFGTGGTERARITSGGDLLVGTTNTSPVDVTANGVKIGGTGYLLNINKVSDPAVALARSSTTGSIVDFYYRSASTTNVGNISTNGTNTAYNTTSDYRLKDNPQPLTDSGAFIDALQPKTWEWKVDGSRGVGFIAHEVQAVSPGSVVGEKDAIDADGKPVMQAMEYGSAEFIANIVAELQSLRARVAALEAK